jgi:hypothetical protein
MRIVDQVRLGQFTVHNLIQRYWDVLKAHGLSPCEAVPVEITNVYEWALEEWAEPDSQKLGRQFEMFRDLRPSFPSAWFEWQVESFEVSEGGGRIKHDASAVWVIADPDENGWIFVYFDRGDGRVMATHSWTVELENISAGSMPLTFHDDRNDTTKGSDLEIAFHASFPVLMAQTLMHCKNVTVVPQPALPKLSKNFQRKHGVRPATFRRVVIDGMQKAIKAAGGVRGIGSEKAMHIVRGNFAEYTEQKPLFGKVSGRFFRPMHTRGNASIGTKEPDYSVQPPKAQADELGR